jgi:short-subunit dehydrogenase
MNRNLRAVLVGTGMGAAAFASAMLVRNRTLAHSFEGKVVVITGGSRGLGLALARELLKQGAHLALAARHEDELQEARETLGTDVLTVPCDLSKPEDAERLIEEATRQFGRVDVLINNASVIHVGPVEKQTIESYREAMENNFFTMLNTTYAVLPQMLERRAGAIANIASIGGKIPVPHLAPYVASKFAAVGFSETLHAELRSKGIRVTTINPGLMRTGSYPNALVVGRKEEEYRWFRVSASIPGLAHSASGAARTILQAIAEGQVEIEIGLDAYLAARIHGLVPAASQFVGSVAEQLILPRAGGDSNEETGTEVKAPEGVWKAWSNLLTRRFHQPEA